MLRTELPSLPRQTWRPTYTGAPAGSEVNKWFSRPLEWEKCHLEGKIHNPPSEIKHPEFSVNMFQPGRQYAAGRGRGLEFRQFDDKQQQQYVNQTLLLVYYQLSQLVRSSVNQIPIKPKCYISGFLQGHERCPGIAVKDDPRTFWHVPRKMAGSRMFTLRQLWPFLEKVTSVLNHPGRRNHQLWQNEDPENISGIYFNQDVNNIAILLSPTKSIMSQSQNCTTPSCSTSNCLYEHLQWRCWCWVLSFFFFKSAYKEAINGRNSFTPEIRLHA